MLEKDISQKERRHADVGPYHRSLLKRIFFSKNRFGADPIGESVSDSRDLHNFGNQDFAGDRIWDTRRRLGVIYGRTINDWSDPILKEKQRQAKVLGEAVQFGQFFRGNQFAKINNPDLEKEIKRRLRVRETDKIGVRPTDVNKAGIGYLLIVAENRERMGTLFFQDQILNGKNSIYEEVIEVCKQAINSDEIVLFPEERRAYDEYLATHS